MSLVRAHEARDMSCVCVCAEIRATRRVACVFLSHRICGNFCGLRVVSGVPAGGVATRRDRSAIGAIAARAKMPVAGGAHAGRHGLRRRLNEEGRVAAALPSCLRPHLGPKAA